MSSDRVLRIKTEIAEIFDSKNEEWITVISLMIDVMYQQFIREFGQERQESASHDVPLDKRMVEGGANLIRRQRRRRVA
jgi:hypothetical protein